MSTTDPKIRHSKITIRIFEDDFRYLKVAYPSAGYNRIIRSLVQKHVRSLRSLTLENLSPEIKLTDEELQNV